MWIGSFKTRKKIISGDFLFLIYPGKVYSNSED